jgi:hypothetical protein
MLLTDCSSSRTQHPCHNVSDPPDEQWTLHLLRLLQEGGLVPILQGALPAIIMTTKRLTLNKKLTLSRHGAFSPISEAM